MGPVAEVPAWVSDTACRLLSGRVEGSRQRLQSPAWVRCERPVAHEPVPQGHVAWKGRWWVEGCEGSLTTTSPIFKNPSGLLCRAAALSAKQTTRAQTSACGSADIMGDEG